LNGVYGEEFDMAWKLFYNLLVIVKVSLNKEYFQEIHVPQIQALPLVS